jgi:hypothetical protein
MGAEGGLILCLCLYSLRSCGPLLAALVRRRPEGHRANPPRGGCEERRQNPPPHAGRETPAPGGGATRKESAAAPAANRSSQRAMKPARSPARHVTIAHLHPRPGGAALSRPKAPARRVCAAARAAGSASHWDAEGSPFRDRHDTKAVPWIRGPESKARPVRARQRANSPEGLRARLYHPPRFATEPGYGRKSLLCQTCAQGWSPEPDTLWSWLVTRSSLTTRADTGRVKTGKKMVTQRRRKSAENGHRAIRRGSSRPAHCPR